MTKRYQNTSRRTPSTSRDIDVSHNPGPFVAIVVNNVDPTYMGRLTVVLQTKVQSGANPEFRENQIVVDYCPPFFGATPIQSLKLPSDELPWVSGQKSYGMWFVPPDIGARVLVIFTEGNQGYWIGCIPEAGMNFMTPGVDTATEINDAGGNRKFPVAEYQKNKFDRLPSDLTQTPKPVNTDLFVGLAIKGLENDPTRGFTTASAQRETPSSVFGISTPGPRDRRVGPVRENNRAFFNRLGGSSFVMDDGNERFNRKGDAADTASEYVDQAQDNAGEEGDNTIPHGEMLRLKTRTGHQILLHNSEDLIYIGNSRGTAWIELTSNGKIDIYSQDSISVHTDTDINFRASRDVNIEAGRDINLKSNRDTTVESVDDFQLLAGRDNKITTKNNLDINVENSVKIQSNSNSINILAEIDNNFTAFGNTNILSGDKSNDELPATDGNTNIFSVNNNNFTADKKDTNILSGRNHIESTPKGKIKMNNPDLEKAKKAESVEAEESIKISPLQTWVLPGSIQSITRRVPTKEPWPHHENLNPLFFTSAETNIKKPNSSGTGITDDPPQTAEYVLTVDAFRQIESTSLASETFSQESVSFQERITDSPETAPNVSVPTDLVEFIKSKESFKPQAFFDFNQISIGYGTKARFPGEEINEEEAEQRLKEDLAYRRQFVIDFAEKNNYSWNETQIDALTSFIFNLGVGSLAQVTKSGTRSNEEIAERMKLYINAGGQQLEGLITRRQEESAWFLS